MKKGMLIFGTLVLFAIVSCKKDRACSCYTEITSGYYSGSGTEDTVFTNISKKNAETRCEALEENVTTMIASWTTTCALK